MFFKMFDYLKVIKTGSVLVLPLPEWAQDGVYMEKRIVFRPMNMDR